jgi:hypothetical protein
MAQEENKKAKQTAQTQPEETDLQTQPEETDLQTQPEETDLTDWDKTQTYMKKGADLKDLETK